MNSLDILRSPNKDLPSASNRRINPRFGVPRCHVYSGGERVHLLNLGRSGMAIESYGRCNFSRSENHQFVLDDGVNSIEVVGNVSWVFSSWLDDEQLPGTGLVQTVGISFQEVLTPYRVGIWRGIESLVIAPENSGQPLVPLADNTAEITRPPVIMDKPHDGSVFSSRFISVEGDLQNSETVSRIRINGFEASIDGSRFSARVQLSRNVNYLCAVISHWNKVDSTCFLGKVVRESDDIDSPDDPIENSSLKETRYRVAPHVVAFSKLPND